MAEYTAEDFANARFAEHPDPLAVDARYAARMNQDPEYPWLLDGVPGNGDEHMARDGWRPVMESRILERAVRELQQDLAVARKENRRLDAEADGAISLDGLRHAWENAEQSEDCREGDVLMTRHSDDNYEVWVAVGAFDISGKSRILRRAPQPEPWQALADVLADMGHMSPTGHAKALHERGVRVAGGDDVIERVAHGIHATHDRGWHFDAEDHAVQDEYREMARAALTAAIGDE